MKSQKQHKMPTEEGPERSRGVSVGVQVHGVWRGNEEHVAPTWGRRKGLNLSRWEAYLNGVTAVNVWHAAFVTPRLHGIQADIVAHVVVWLPGWRRRSSCPFFVLHIGNHGSLLP